MFLAHAENTKCLPVFFLIMLCCNLLVDFFIVKKGKCMFLHSAVSSPLDRSKRFTLFLPWQTCSFQHQLGFSWKHSSHAAVTRIDYSLTFTQLSIVRYSFIQLSEEGCQWRERKCTIFETLAKGDSNPGSLDCESGILKLSYSAAQRSKQIFVVHVAHLLSYMYLVT